MNKVCIAVLVLGLMLGGSSCGRSTEKPKGSSPIEQPKTEGVIENDILGEGEVLEEDAKLQEEGKGAEPEASDEEQGDEE